MLLKSIITSLVLTLTGPVPLPEQECKFHHWVDRLVCKDKAPPPIDCPDICLYGCKTANECNGKPHNDFDLPIIAEKLERENHECYIDYDVFSSFGQCVLNSTSSTFTNSVYEWYCDFEEEYCTDSIGYEWKYVI